MFLHNFLPKTLLFYIFSSGAPCFASCSFVFALLSLFCLFGGAFSYTFKAFLSLGGPFSYIYVFFSGHALSPKVGGPYVLAQFSAQSTRFLTFFIGGPLFCFLFFCFCSFKAFLSLGGPFSYIYVFFSGHALSPKVGAPMFWRNFLLQTLFFFTCFPRGPLVLLLVKIVGSFKAFLCLGTPFKTYFISSCGSFLGSKATPKTDRAALKCQTSSS